MKDPLILVINPGSTSTKMAVYQGKDRIHEKNVSHDESELKRYQSVKEQLLFRQAAVLDFLNGIKLMPKDLSCVMGRGGVLSPVEGGTYLIDDAMCHQLSNSIKNHASNLGALIAKNIADEAGIKAYIADPTVVDEMEPLARISGYSGVERKSVFHALNQKACARKAACSLNKKYEECCIIVAHLGGGISVGAHKKGKVVDVNNCLDGDGPFSPERAGGVPVYGILDICSRGGADKNEIYKSFVGRGGLVSYLGTKDARVIEKMIAAGNENAGLVFEAMAYQIAKEIGACAAVLKGEVDAIVITGGLVHSKRLIEWILERIRFLAPVLIYPGEDEVEALAMAGIRVMTGEEDYKIYKSNV
jgi:butyrate kinase